MLGTSSSTVRVLTSVMVCRMSMNCLQVQARRIGSAAHGCGVGPAQDAGWWHGYEISVIVIVVVVGWVHSVCSFSHA